MSNNIMALLLSLIRTFVPILVGSVISWFFTRGIELDPETGPLLEMIITGIIIGLYYLVIRLLETYVKPWFGWALGAAKTPAVYTTESNVGQSKSEVVKAVADELDANVKITLTPERKGS